MKRLVFLALWFVVAAACRPTGYGRIAELERRSTATAVDLDEVERQARALSTMWEDVASAYERASASYKSATREYERVRSNARRASIAYRRAAKIWKQAALAWEIARQLIVLATILDAQKLAAQRARKNVRLPKDCQRMSTPRYRRLLKAQGADLTGKDIDHIVPRSLGGADHASNYQVLPSSVNRSLGDTWNRSKCLMRGAKSCAAAVAVSNVCGRYSGGVPTS